MNAKFARNKHSAPLALDYRLNFASACAAVSIALVVKHDEVKAFAANAHIFEKAHDMAKPILRKFADAREKS